MTYPSDLQFVSIFQPATTRLSAPHQLQEVGEGQLFWEPCVEGLHLCCWHLETDAASADVWEICLKHLTRKVVAWKDWNSWLSYEDRGGLWQLGVLFWTLWNKNLWKQQEATAMSLGSQTSGPTWCQVVEPLFTIMNHTSKSEAQNINMTFFLAKTGFFWP